MITLELLYILLAVLIVSFISLIGIFFTQKLLSKYSFWAVSFAAGVLFATAFFDLMPEAMELNPENGRMFIYVLVGIIVFFVAEKFLYWYHCHEGKCPTHMFTYMNLFGDAVHNFIDGIIIAATFITDIALGIITSLAVMFHEIPQEISDFALLVHGGFSRRKAIWYNFLVALAAVAGAILTYFISTVINTTAFLIPFAAGGFIYIAGSDLIPELHKELGVRKSLTQFGLFILGIIVMYAVGNIVGH
jgi:zinc and cadmium transporter